MNLCGNANKDEDREWGYRNIPLAEFIVFIKGFSGLDVAHDICLGLLFMEEPDWLVNLRLAYRHKAQRMLWSESARNYGYGTELICTDHDETQTTIWKWVSQRVINRVNIL